MSLPVAVGVAVAAVVGGGRGGLRLVVVAAAEDQVQRSADDEHEHRDQHRAAEARRARTPAAARALAHLARARRGCGGGRAGRRPVGACARRGIVALRHRGDGPAELAQPLGGSGRPVARERVAGHGRARALGLGVGLLAEQPVRDPAAVDAHLSNT